MNLTTTDSQTTGIPLVIATPTQQPTARLQLRDAHGQVTQQWLVKSNKCTLGSAVSCSLRCELPGVAPYHALLVIGARQIFIRALAPELTRDGQPFNELLLTNDDSHFEIAGHRFELSRNHAEVEPTVQSEATSPQRIKFTLARPFELRNRSQAALSSHANTAQLAAEALFDSPPNRDASGDAKWVAQLIQAAMQPLECQLQNLAAPLQELQQESRKQSRIQSRKQSRLRKRRATLKSLAIDTAATAADTEDSSSAAVDQPTQQSQLAEQVEAIAVKHSAAMDVLGQRVTEVSQQLQAIERIVAEQRQVEQARAEPQAAADSPQLTLQSAAIEQLQQSVVSVSDTLERLQAEQLCVREDDQQWRDGLQSQLGSLAQVIEGLSASVTEVHHVALRAAAQPATPEAWGAAHDQLAQPSHEPVQTTWSVLEAEEGIAEPDVKFESRDEAEASLLPESSQPHHEAQPVMWSVAESDEPMTPSDDGLETRGQAASSSLTELAPSGSAALPSWWADDDSEAGQQVDPSSEQAFSEQYASEEFASEQYASEQYASEEFASEHYAGEEYANGKGYASEEYVETTGNDIAEEVYDSTSDCDDRVSESVYPAQIPSAAADDSGLGQPSEEFFGLAQLDIEEHLSEAEPLASYASQPLAQQPLAQQPPDQQPPNQQPLAQQSHDQQPLVAVRELHIPADELNVNQPDWTPQPTAELALTTPDVESLESEATLSGLDQIGDAASSPALEEQRGEELAAEVDETDSVEEYMRKLLARMRGVPEDEVQLQQPAEVKPAESLTRATSPTTSGSAGERSSESSAAQPATSNYAADTVSGADGVTEPFDLEKYMPRALAPERSNSLAAMRELANSSARTAIHKSTRQRHVSSIVLKSVIACVGLVVGMVLLAINGLNLNIGLVATVASFMVAAIWGYDSISSIRPMLQNGLVLKPQAGSAPKPSDAQD